MKKAAIVGVAALSIAAGSVALASVMPIGAALAQNTGSPTTPPIDHPQAADAREGFAHKRDDLAKRFGAKIDDIASFLGITADDLRTQLKTKSLGEIAGAKKADLIAHLTDQVNARVDQAVTNGKLTKERAAEVKAQAASRVTRLVDALGGGKGPLGRRGAMRGRHGR